MASTDAPFQFQLPKNDEVEYVKQKVLESGSSYPSKCRVLLLSVSAGAGKSALINTARAVFNDSYLEHVEQGDDDEDKHLRGSVTEVAQSHPLFHAGVEKEDMDRVRITDTPGALTHGAAHWPGAICWVIACLCEPSNSIIRDVKPQISLLQPHAHFLNLQLRDLADLTAR